jgi:hypothetical protein
LKLKAFVMFALVAFMSSSAFAQWFPARVNVVVLPGQVTAEVFNPFYEPIICNGQVFGQTFQGQIYNAFFAEQFMPAGSYRVAFVQAFPFNPFATGWANIHCRFARFW